MATDLDAITYNLPGQAPDDSKRPSDEEIASASRNYFEPVFNGLMRPSDDTLLSRGGALSYKIYDEIERDAHAYSVLNKRKMAVIGREWTLTPASDSRIDKKACDMVQAALDGTQFDVICYKLLDAILKGFSVGEIMYAPGAGQVSVTDVLARSQRRFVFDVNSNLRLLTRGQAMYGEALPARKFIVHRFGSNDSNPYGLGLGTRLFWLVFFKRQGMQFWLTFLDKFGSPTALGKYPSGASQAAKDALLSAASSFSQESAIAIPSGMDIALVEAARAGNAGYETLCRYLDDEMSKAVLGETMSTTSKGSGLGSGAQAAVHNEVRLELVKGDADLLAGTLNKSLIAWLVQYNMPGATPPRLSWDVSEPTDRLSIAQADQVVFNMGFEPSDEYIAETYGDGWTRKPPPTNPPPPGAIGAPGQPPALAQFAEPAAATVDGTDRQTQRLAQSVDPAIRAWIEAVRGVIDMSEAKSLTDVREQLLSAYPNMTLTEVAQGMQAAMGAAQLAGRYDLMQGLGG